MRLQWAPKGLLRGPFGGPLGASEGGLFLPRGLLVTDKRGQKIREGLQIPDCSNRNVLLLLLLLLLQLRFNSSKDLLGSQQQRLQQPRVPC